jgi:magnesium transporter
MPGSLFIDQDALPPSIDIICYNESELVETDIDSVDELAQHQVEGGVTWVNVVGLGSVELLHDIAKRWNLHLLAMEDVVSIPQRAKLDQYGDHLFFVTHMPHLVDDVLGTEQFSFFFAENFIITFQEREGDCFKQVRTRLREGRGRLRKRRADYLAYALVDSILDSYFPIMDEYHEDLDDLEDEILEQPSNELVEDLLDIRREVLEIRRSLHPTRQALEDLMSDDSGIVQEETNLYLRDVTDHAVRLVESFETIRENALNMMEVYMTVASQQMNEIMKVLTIISTIFIPLGFVAGLYGMNFNPDVSRWNMPELSNPYGYPIIIGVMLSMVLGMLYFFKRKRWL